MTLRHTISVRNLGKCYNLYANPSHRLLGTLTGERLGKKRTHWALQDVSFDVAAGRTVGIIGVNGSGKSTLLQLVAGTLTPTTGSVKLFGKVAALLELGAGFNPEFTGRENVAMTASLYGLSDREIAERLPSIEAFAEIGEFIDQPVRTYSSGMFVRLAFAVIAHVDAQVLIIDEALAVGDAYFTQKCMRFLQAFMETGSVLFVSHDIAAVRALADEVLWIDHGRVRARGDPKAVSDDYLESLYARAQPVERCAQPRTQVTRPVLDEDCRARDLAEPPWRNEITVFAFRPDDPGFGDGAATIVDVSLCDESGNPVPVIGGGEEVILKAVIEVHQQIIKPIVGFFLRNRFGQYVFGDNSYFIYRDNPLTCPPGTQLKASFLFRMPFLPAADYSFCVAVASGSSANHVQHHWVNEALLIRSISANIHADLIGIPMHRISLEVGDPV